jgi:hypothetical protein
MYAGTIYSSLERDDYLPLPGLTPVNGEYQLKIANELLERQYINMAELIIVNTPHYSQALIDKNGQIHTVLKPELPSTALSDNKVDYTKAILKKDNTSYLFNEEHENPEKLSNITFTFNNAHNAKTGKHTSQI